MRYAFAALLATVLVGCSSSPTATSPDKTSSPTPIPTSATAPAGTPSSAPSPTPTQSDAGLATLGDTLTFDDGLEVTVTANDTGKVTAEAEDWDGSVKKGEDAIKLKVRVRNGSSSTVDLYVEPTVTYGEDGEKAEQAYQNGDPDSYLFAGKVAPDRSRTGNFWFAVPRSDQDDVQVALSVGSDYAEVVFTGDAS